MLVCFLIHIRTCQSAMMVHLPPLHQQLVALWFCYHPLAKAPPHLAHTQAHEMLESSIQMRCCSYSHSWFHIPPSATPLSLPTTLVFCLCSHTHAWTAPHGSLLILHLQEVMLEPLTCGSTDAETSNL